MSETTEALIERVLAEHMSRGTSGRFIVEYTQTPATLAAAIAQALADRERPKWVDLFGIAPDFTGGQDINDFLDESRGEA